MAKLPGIRERVEMPCWDRPGRYHGVVGLAPYDWRQHDSTTAFTKAEGPRANYNPDCAVCKRTTERAGGEPTACWLCSAVTRK